MSEGQKDQVQTPLLPPLTKPLPGLITVGGSVLDRPTTLLTPSRL